MVKDKIVKWIVFLVLGGALGILTTLLWPFLAKSSSMIIIVVKWIFIIGFFCLVYQLLGNIIRTHVKGVIGIMGSIVCSAMLVWIVSRLYILTARELWVWCIIGLIYGVLIYMLYERFDKKQ